MVRSTRPGHRARRRLLALVAVLALGSQDAISADDGISACHADAMIVFDASGSMATSDYTLKLPRIARAKQSMAKVIPEVAPLRRLGLIVYGEGAYNDCSSIALRLPPTSNAAEPLLRIVQSVNPRGKTPLTRSVQLAAEELHYTEREAVVVLLTDGEETCGGDPCKMAAMLKKAGPEIDDPRHWIPGRAGGVLQRALLGRSDGRRIRLRVVGRRTRQSVAQDARLSICDGEGAGAVPPQPARRQ